MVYKPLRGGDWTGREEIHIETTAIRKYLSMLASGGGLSVVPLRPLTVRPVSS